MDDDKIAETRRDIARYKALLRIQLDQKVREVLSEMITELEKLLGKPSTHHD